MKIVTVVGARPQFIKLTAVSRQLRATPGVEDIVIHTGQHFDDAMSRIFFDEMQIPLPDHSLDVGSGPHGQQTGKMLDGIEKVLVSQKPDWLLVYGDTNSTLAGALAAAKLNIPVAHVEAGLRSFNRRMPEEINRIVTDHVATLNFAPTDSAIVNLRNEGIAERTIRKSGDVMLDVARIFEPGLENRAILDDLDLRSEPYILATIHRAENTDDPALLQEIFKGFVELSETYRVVLPLHPRTRNALEKNGGLPNAPRLHLIAPVGYLDMAALEKHAALIATDSGGVQKEAFFFRRPCLTLRGETEWIELVELGWNRLCAPTNGGAAIAQAARETIGMTGQDSEPYGDGNSARQIVNALRGA
ncbi:MAG TPA: UDP-N-acetylglucosamine 2-epimerase (non-hydrolyzing) [Rhizomicrobium sp.]|jgi:UDP-GlcNAc3NAcA epimerase|nr:UDP-N-acetylglucosamine 2-epimerase (non-hydrolyzing) [Rhizomicrobium sp.]